MAKHIEADYEKGTDKPSVVKYTSKTTTMPDYLIFFEATGMELCLEEDASVATGPNYQYCVVFFETHKNGVHKKLSGENALHRKSKAVVTKEKGGDVFTKQRTETVERIQTGDFTLSEWIKWKGLPVDHQRILAMLKEASSEDL